MRLTVELYGTTVGHLTGDTASFDFAASSEGIARFGAASTILSVALPLSPKLPRHRAARRRRWFAELLPEGNQYDYMLSQARLARGDTLSFLARYGRDVGGALQIWDADDPSEPPTPATNPLTTSDVRQLLESPTTSPLGNIATHGKSSLAGMQPKVVLVRNDQGWAQATGGFPTTHIVKPQTSDHPTTIYDEEYGARLGRALGIIPYETWIEDFDGADALVIERFDRDGTARIHQEDFSQALGVSGNQKYQEFGGAVSLARVAGTLTQFAPHQSLAALARAVVLAVVVGNLDMHTKNIALLHPPDEQTVLAPAFDVVPQTHVPGIDGRLALSINGTYRHSSLTQSDLSAEFRRWRLARADDLIDDALSRLLSTIDRELPLPGAHPRLHDDITRFCTNLAHGRPVGDE